MAYTLKHRASRRGATFVEYAILAAIALAIGEVIFLLLSHSSSGGKKHVTTTTIARVVKQAAKHATSTTALGVILEPIAFIAGLLFVVMLLVKIIRWVAMGGASVRVPGGGSSRSTSVGSAPVATVVPYDSIGRLETSIKANATQLGGALATAVSGTKDGVLSLGTLSAPQSLGTLSASTGPDEPGTQRQVLVGAVSSRKERWHRKASGQPKFR